MKSILLACCFTSTSRTELFNVNDELYSAVRVCWLLFAILSFLGSVSCVKERFSQKIEGQKVVAMVERTTITTKHISYKIGIEQAYGNEKITPEAALISLINDDLEVEAALMHSVAVSEDEMDSFKRYVDENTKAPEILQKVKLVFGNDLPSYERIYLAPKIINWKLRDFYSRNQELHKTERALIEKARSLMSSGKTFQETAEEFGLKAITFDIEDKTISIPTELKNYVQQPEEQLKDPLISILETLSTGEVYKNIIEDDYGLRVIRLLGKTNNKYSVEAITVSKKPFDDWLKDQTTKIKIEIIDSEMKKSIKTRYPDIWWVKRCL